MCIHSDTLDATMYICATKYVNSSIFKGFKVEKEPISHLMNIDKAKYPPCTISKSTPGMIVI